MSTAASAGCSSTQTDLLSTLFPHLLPVTPPDFVLQAREQPAVSDGTAAPQLPGMHHGGCRLT
jgi:hypothetical protein